MAMMETDLICELQLNMNFYAQYCFGDKYLKLVPLFRILNGFLTIIIIWRIINMWQLVPILFCFKSCDVWKLQFRPNFIGI